MCSSTDDNIDIDNELCDIEGTCHGMCPPEEIKTRMKENIFHIVECIPGMEKSRKPKPDPHRMVKAFSRSAAGKETEKAELLRPCSVLLETICYLLKDVLDDDRFSLPTRYSFIEDRMRAIRQDMIIQNFTTIQCIIILQPLIKFYAYSAYLLCNEEVPQFDPQINNTHLQECLKRLLCAYDYCDKDYMQKCALKSVKDVIPCGYIINERCFFESLYLIFNIGDETALNRALSLPDRIRKNVVNQAFQMSLDYSKKNFVRVCRNMKDLPMLLAAVASLHLQKIRRESFMIMSKAYSNIKVSYPTKQLARSLLYSSPESLIEDCNHYGLSANDISIAFVKKTFNPEASLLPNRHEEFIEEKMLGFRTEDLFFD